MKSSKRKRINFLKVLRVVSITAVLVVIMVFAIKSTASGSTRDSYKEITICPGDTLWTISRGYSRGENIQKVIYEIMDFNNMEVSDIYSGQKLKIPLKY